MLVRILSQDDVVTPTIKEMCCNAFLFFSLLVHMILLVYFLNALIFLKHQFIFISVCWMAIIDCFQATNSQTRGFRRSTGRQTCMKNIAMVANQNMGLGFAVFSICYTLIFVNAFFLVFSTQVHLE